MSLRACETTATDPITLSDAAATAALGRSLAARLLPLCTAGRAPLLLLQGELGAGKTCLVQGLAAGLGIDEPITSPTFALAQRYQGRLEGGPMAGAPTALVHLDLYRLDTPAAADELLAQEEEEARSLGALLAVEWPERLSSLPSGAWLLQLSLIEADDPEAGRLARLRC
ncbi:MAG: tRNA (adenosine(37)-N6)-threonylcarbamoyltransferase complex ATPase subunit type 1 TsaE [Synechococcaceae cyanobacterium]|nr:tRNA (adenosine(37)-N6)-threonylcarbamoyltransferase complex ATPase subunit type 1 TsaE [Synechococcaceae cyanobacterium]